jgi:hypothetical protein
MTLSTKQRGRLHKVFSSYALTMSTIFLQKTFKEDCLRYQEGPEKCNRKEILRTKTALKILGASICVTGLKETFSLFIKRK